MALLFCSSWSAPDSWRGAFGRLDPNLDFTIQRIRRVPAGNAISWAAMPGHAYQIYYASSLTNFWTNLPSSSITAASLQLSLSYTDAPPSTISRRLYRVRLLP